MQFNARPPNAVSTASAKVSTRIQQACAVALKLDRAMWRLAWRRRQPREAAALSSAVRQSVQLASGLARLQRANADGIVALAKVREERPRHRVVVIRMGEGGTSE